MNKSTDTTASSRAQASSTLSQPPGPKGNWLLGHLRELEEPLDFHLQLTREYGDVSRYRALFWSVILLNHPDGVRHVLQDNNRNYDKQNLDYKMLKPVAGEGLLTSDGSFWLRQRRMIQPIFQRKRIESFASMMVEETVRMVDERWQPYLRHGTPFDVADEMMRLTLRIVGQALFHMDLTEEAASIGEAFAVVSRHLGKFGLSTFLPKWLPFGPNREYHRALKSLNRTVYGMIDRRRRELLASPEDVPYDLLTLLLQAQDDETGAQMDDKQVRDEVITLMIAGHETTANALAWTWHLLTHHPKVYDRLLAEVDEVLNGAPPTLDDLPRLPYTLQVLEESMRLYPPAWVTSRNTVADDEFAGYRIPQGTIVVVSPYTTHRHPAFWPDPERFDPDRFAPNAPERPRFAYFPFGGGPRLCIGKHFAMIEAHLVLATIAQRVRLQHDPSHQVQPEALITLRPKDDIMVTAHTHDKGQPL